LSSTSTTSGAGALPGRIAVALLAMALVCVLGLLAGAAGGAGAAAVVGHAVLFAAAGALFCRLLNGPARLVAAVSLLLVVGISATIWIPGQPASLRIALSRAHVVLGGLGMAVGVVVALRWRLPPRIALASVGLLLPVGYVAAELQRGSPGPPAYDAEACYRFLTATGAEQAGESFFPSALRVRQPLVKGGEPGCQASGCHAGVHSGWLAAHAGAASSPAYRAIARDYRKRHDDGDRWCRGCHAPASLAETAEPDREAGITCLSCHAVTKVHALYGGGALTLDLRGGRPNAAEVALRPATHAARYGNRALLRSAEFCGGCHRKNWNLPQNNYGWVHGPDEYRKWRESGYSGSALYSVGGPGTFRKSRACIDCHSTGGALNLGPAHGPDPRGLELDVFVRSPGAIGEIVAPFERASPPPGTPVLLDVVIRNSGIGHDFPTGMPDLQESWLEVRVREAGGPGNGRDVAGSGVGGPGAAGRAAPHAYRLLGLDGRGDPVPSGQWDRMVAAAEARRIPAGGCDLARYRWTLPKAGLGAVTVRLLRRKRAVLTKRPEPAVGEPEVLTAATLDPANPPQDSTDPARWRHYAEALAAVKAYPAALQALRQPLAAFPHDPETLLVLGRVHLENGDLLAAQEQFARARKGAPERAAAWEGAVLRQMGQPDQAAALLAPLARRYPQDLRLRFELGQTYFAQLRNDAAAREFGAMLDVDPTDLKAHFNVFRCAQRMNRLSEARREEVVYRLLNPEEGAPVLERPRKGASLEDRPLHDHLLEPLR
jgi:Flp pilus assembly protein TadD